MIKEIEEQLQNNKYDIKSIPVIVYKADNVELNGERYLKLYLFNHSNDRIENLSISFDINDTIYIIDKFSIIKEYKNKNIFGCAIKLKDDYKETEFEIEHEIFNGKQYIPILLKKDIEILNNEPKENNNNKEIDKNTKQKITADKATKNKKIDSKVTKEKQNRNKQKTNNKKIVLTIICFVLLVISLIGYKYYRTSKEQERIESINNKALSLYEEGNVNESLNMLKQIPYNTGINEDKSFVNELNNLDSPTKAFEYCINAGYYDMADNYVDYCVAEKEISKGINVKENCEKLIQTEYSNLIKENPYYTEKYLQSLNVGDIFYYGNSNHSWLVIDKVYGKILAIYNDPDMETMQYSEKDSFEWLDSKVHEYLQDYYKNEFSTNEKEFIFEKTIDYKYKEHLFILNEFELKEYEKIIPNDISNSNGSEYWWLRVADAYRINAMKWGIGHANSAVVLGNQIVGGYDNFGGIWVGHKHCVRPTMWLNQYSSTTSIEINDINETSKIGIGQHITFGQYEQDNILDNGKEPIEWIVIDKNDSLNSLTLLSKDIIDWLPYHTKNENVDMEHFYIHEWLNTFLRNKDAYFVNEAFSKEEVDKYQLRAFLLGLDDIENYLGYDVKCSKTEYANSKSNDPDNCAWWFNDNEITLSGWYPDGVRYWHVGTVNDYTHNELGISSEIIVNSSGVRPALWLKLK